MSDVPAKVFITEEGPREGFQFEKSVIPTNRKIELIDGLARTGLKTIQVTSFVRPDRVPGVADAEALVECLSEYPGVSYIAMWLNERGLERAMATKKVKLSSSISLCASGAFLKRNKNNSFEGQIRTQHNLLDMYAAHDVPVTRLGVSAAFGCNFEGYIPVERILELIKTGLEIADEHGLDIHHVKLMDTMAWGTPQKIKRAIGKIRDSYPDLEIGLHLHDTRGMAVANAYAGLEMGIAHYDSSVAGLGGCPFAAHSGAAGNLCTEDFVFLCEEMGIATGIDLDSLTACARLAEEIVGHPLPGSVMRGGSLRALRKAI